MGVLLTLNQRLKQVTQILEPENATPGEQAPLGHVFTHAEMQEVYNDFDSLIKPSWVTSVPNTVSTVGPKLKADQWRTLGSLYLPVTLIRLWTDDDPQDVNSKQRQELLRLTMLLFSAIAVATTRVTSNRHKEEYIAHMVQYRTELKRIFPEYKIRANNHMAFHIPEFMDYYGPVHGWWAYPFERVIGMLQRISTNNKQGELETTIARSWHRSTYFRALFTKSTCPLPISYCAEMFDKLVKTQSRNSFALDMKISSQYGDDRDADSHHDDEATWERASLKPVPIPSDIYSALVLKNPGRNTPRQAVFLPRLTYDSVIYTTERIHEGNSGVLSNVSGTPFSIEHILQFSDEEPLEDTWFIVRRYRKAQIQVDPYVRYPLLRAKIWSTELEETVEVLHLMEIDAHFAKCAIQWENEAVNVVISLSRSIRF